MLPPTYVIEVALADEAATARLAQALAAIARPGDFIALRGDLGAGKTSLARAFIVALAGRPEEVPSPTFTLAQSYETPAGTVWHLDLYRIDDPSELVELGLEDALAGSVTLVEWPDRLGRLLPAERLDVTLEFADQAGGEGRRARLTGHGAWAGRLVGLVLP
ncbi:MAG: tRNA (adenosine(37)-N6)-threonylcarbamoyltransferase complex ATPase subunit type 1 TsaE [Dongiaceae bacterium]